MKKLVAKDRKIRLLIKKTELTKFILKQISLNSNFSKTINWKSLSKLSNFSTKNSKVTAVNRCVLTLNKKSFNKISKFSRIVLLKLIRSGNFSGFSKSSW